MNAYQSTWVTMIPLKGKPTKKDQKLIGFPANGIELSFYNANEQKAIERLNALKGKLSKRHIAVIYTDRQYGMRKPNSDLISILTKKQIAEAQII